MSYGGVITTGLSVQFLEKNGKEMKIAADHLLKETEWSTFVEDKGASPALEIRMQDIEPMLPLPRREENTLRQMMALNPGWSHSFSHQGIGGEVVISELMKRFDTSRLVTRATQELLTAAKLTFEYLLVNYAAAGHTAIGSQTQVNGYPIIPNRCPDGQPFYSASHKWRSDDAITIDNTYGAGAPSEDSIFGVFKKVHRWLGPNGAPMDVKLKGGYGPVDYAMAFNKVLKSIKEPGSASNAINTAPGFFDGEYKVLRHLVATDVWFVKTDAKNGDPCIYWAKKPTAKQYDDPKLDNTHYALDSWFAHGVPIMPLGSVRVGA
jgi:hypothetical protein